MVTKDGFGLKNFVGLIVALFVILIGCVVAVSQVSRHADQVAHTIEVKSDLRKLMSNLQDAETGQRGYLITREVDYRQPYEDAKLTYRAFREELGAQIADNDRQLRRLARVDSLANLKFVELEATMQLVSSGQPEAAIALVKEDAGKRYMDELRDVVQDMIDSENKALEARKAKYEGWRIGIFALLGMAGLLMLISIYGLFHQVAPMFRELEKTKETLRKTVINLSESVDGLKKTNQELKQEIEADHPKITTPGSDAKRPRRSLFRKSHPQK